jgi:hypothetical protein
MLDVHVPQKSEHTWTDFFIHIGTIAVGLLLAIGLEQSVEYIHHARERRELRAALYTESGQVQKDGHNMLIAAEAEIHWIGTRIGQLQAALRDNQPVQSPPQSKLPPGERPSDPIWQAAKTSNSAALLDRDELTAYGELSKYCELSNGSIDDTARARRPAQAYARRFGGDLFTADLSQASRPELQEMLERLGNVQDALRQTAYVLSLTEGAAEAVHNGERDITKIYATEKSVARRDIYEAMARRGVKPEAMDQARARFYEGVQ